MSWPNDGEIDVGKALAAEKQLADDLATVLARHCDDGADTLHLRVIGPICARVAEFRTVRAREQALEPSRDEFRSWHATALKRIAEFAEWLKDVPAGQRGSLPCGSGNAYERIALNRQILLRDLEAFDEDLRWIREPRPGRGRPVDWPRADLEEHVGRILWVAGIRPTVSENGVYVEILRDAVHPAIGLPERDNAAWAAARAAIEHHREWQHSHG